MSTTVAMTVAEFDRLEADSQKHELLEGEHLVSPFPKWGHSELQRRLCEALYSCAPAGSIAYVGMGYQLSDSTLLEPDVSLASREQLEHVRADQWLRGAPSLAVEIVSPSNTAAEIARKVEAYLHHGAREVWVVYPALKQIHVHEPGGKASRRSDEVRSSVAPGLVVKLDELFTGLV
jgi:Uma2 family endonuclease